MASRIPRARPAFAPPDMPLLAAAVDDGLAEAVMAAAVPVAAEITELDAIAELDEPDDEVAVTIVDADVCCDEEAAVVWLSEFLVLVAFAELALAEEVLSSSWESEVFCTGVSLSVWGA